MLLRHPKRVNEPEAACFDVALGGHRAKHDYTISQTAYEKCQKESITQDHSATGGLPPTPRLFLSLYRCIWKQRCSPVQFVAQLLCVCVCVCAQRLNTLGWLMSSWMGDRKHF